MSDPQTVEQPTCPRCEHRHRPELHCWTGAYAANLTHLTLQRSRTCWIAGPRCKGWASVADHFLPRALGGGDELDNLLPACTPCNAARGRRLNPFHAETPTPPTGRALSERWSSPA